MGSVCELCRSLTLQSTPFTHRPGGRAGGGVRSGCSGRHGTEPSGAVRGGCVVGESGSWMSILELPAPCRRLAPASHLPLLCTDRLFAEMELMSPAAPLPTAVGDTGAETQHVLSKEDFVKLMLPDSPFAEEGRRKVSGWRGRGRVSGNERKVYDGDLGIPRRASPLTVQPAAPGTAGQSPFALSVSRASLEAGKGAVYRRLDSIEPRRPWSGTEVA